MSKEIFLNRIQVGLANGEKLDKILLQNRTKDFKSFLITETEFLNDYYQDIRKGIRPIDRLFCIVNNITELKDIPICKNCNEKHVLFLRDGKVGFSEVCSQSCGIVYGGTKNGNPEVSQKASIKRKETVQNKYGVTHVSQLDEIKEKKSETAIKNYGSLKEAYYDTSQKTIREKYGVDNVSQHEDIKEKKIQTSIKNYGSRYPWQSERGKQEQKNGIINKYGVDNVSKLDYIKCKKNKTNIEKYGIYNYSKTIDFMEKMAGDNNPNWKGGISGDGYCNIWKDIDFKTIILERDKYSCLNPTCSKKDIYDLTIHHIDYDKLNCDLNNLVTLCRSCNGIANGDREWHEDWYRAIILKRYGKRGL